MAKPRDRPIVLIPADCDPFHDTGDRISDLLFVRYHANNVLLVEIGHWLDFR